MRCAQAISLTVLLVLCTLQWSSAVPPPTHPDITLEFGVNMYREICSKNTGQNVLFSPTSMSTSLGMVHLGAGGNTKTQLKNVLKFNLPDDEIYKIYKRIIEILSDKANLYTVHLAVHLYGSTKFTYSDVYQKESQNYFHQNLESLDFIKTEDSRKRINDWVLKQTGGKIKEFLLKGSIKSSTVLEIIGALHVSAKWKYSFNAKDTKPGTFTTSTDEKIQMDMMHLRPTLLNYTVSKELDCEIVELPFVGSNLVMYFALPRSNLVTVQKKLTAKALTEAYNNLKETQVEVYLPKFVTDQRIPLMSHLKTLGMIDLFDVKTSNLSGILAKGSPGRLYASETTHKTLWEINEYGLNVEITKPVEPPPVKPTKPTKINFNRPFLMMIKEKVANVVLLCGHVLTKPTIFVEP